MFQITVVSNIPGTPAVALYYRTQENADIAHLNIHNAQKGTIPTQVLVQRDDYGALLTMDRDHIGYAVLIDGEKQAEMARMMPGKPQETL